MESILKTIGGFFMSMVLLIGKPLGMFKETAKPDGGVSHPLGVSAENYAFMSSSGSHPVYRLTCGFLALCVILFSCVLLPMVMKLLKGKKTRRRKSKTRKRTYRRK